MIESYYYDRNLPHWQPANAVLFITFRLDGTLPKDKIIQLKEEYEFRLKVLKNRHKDKTEEVLKKAIKKDRAFYFSKYDAILDGETHGPTHLKDKKIAQLMSDSLHFWFNAGRYKLICFTIMSNHVHLVIYKLEKPLFRTLQSLKSYTAKKANEYLNQKNKTFWQHESYDHIVRDRQELKTTIAYILNNPVKAKMVENWRDWMFTYLNPEFEKFVDF